MIQAVTCASTKTNVQKVQSIGIGVVKPNIYSVSVSVSTTMPYIAYGYANSCSCPDHSATAHPSP